MVIIYFENNVYAQVVATFNTEDLYIKCLPVLEEEANRLGMVVTESIEEL